MSLRDSGRRVLRCGGGNFKRFGMRGEIDVGFEVVHLDIIDVS